MVCYSQIKDLDDLKAKFQDWKQSNPSHYIPKGYWNDVFYLLPKYGLKAVAKLVEFTPLHLMSKQRKKSSHAEPEISLAGIQVNSPILTPIQIQVNLRNNQGIAVELSLTGYLKGISTYISVLLKEEES